MATPTLPSALVPPDLLENDAPIDFRDRRYSDVFKRLQGNIVKGHGRDYTVSVFLEFTMRDDDLRRALRWVTRKYVMSAHDQLVEAEQYRQFHVPGSLFGNLFLTAGAYEKLGAVCRLPEWFRDPDKGGADDVKANFLDGMFAARDELGDPTPSCDDCEPLQAAYLGKSIDAMILLADDSKEFLLRSVRRLMTRLARHKIARVVAVEHGAALRNSHGEGIEHFGYIDGRSQPLFLTSDFDDPDEEETNIWNPFARLSLALRKDPGVPDDPLAFGSFYVFRKLEQDVDAFARAEQTLADALELTDSDRDRAGAMIIGRFKDGTPLVLSKTAGFLPGKANNFRYDNLDKGFVEAPGVATDPLGAKCPFQAHIRKLNPRQNVNVIDSTETVAALAEDDRSHRIVRRGITYGVRAKTLDDRPTQGVGLLFACFQSSIRNQFAFMQQNWANEILFRVGSTSANQTGIDCLIGQRPTGEILPHHWMAEYDGPVDHTGPIRRLKLSLSHRTPLAVHGFVRFKGGEFFFAPSLPFLLGE